MQHIEIVKLKPSEWQVYKEIQLEALKEEPQAFGGRYAEWINFSDEKWQERPSNKDSLIFVAKDEEKLVGLIGVHFENDQEERVAHLWGMYVNKKYRGKKIGEDLIENALKEIKNTTHVKRARLMVEYEPTPAQMLYKKLGFQPTGTTDYLLGDGKTHKLYIMEKAI